MPNKILVTEYRTVLPDEQLIADEIDKTRHQWNRADRSATDVIGITFAQLAREAVCFVGLACLSERHRGFVQRTRSDRWIVIKESDAFKSFAGVIEIPTLKLDFTGE